MSKAIALTSALLRLAMAKRALLAIDMTVEEFTEKSISYRYSETLEAVDRLMRNDTYVFDVVYHALFTCYEPRAKQSYTCTVCDFGVPGSDGMQPIPSLRHPWVTTTYKRDASAFKSAPNHDDLHQLLQAASVDTLYIVGINTDWCVSATVLDALDLGYTVFPVRDGMSAHNGQAGHSKGLTTMEVAMGWHGGRSRIIDSSEINGSDIELISDGLASEIAV